MKKNLDRLVPLALAIALLTIANSALAGIIYDVNRSWTDGSQNASLVGTVDVDFGTYAVTSGSSNPFNSISLTMTVGATSFNVTNALLSSISGGGVFNIDATLTQLIFNPIGTGGGPADLFISDGASNSYVIGSDGNPAFERAISSAGSPISNSGPVYPVVWGTVSASIPEPATLALMGLGLAGLGYRKRK